MKAWIVPVIEFLTELVRLKRSKVEHDGVSSDVDPPVPPTNEDVSREKGQ